MHDDPQQKHPERPPERPHFEPEIIPPNQAHFAARERVGVFVGRTGRTRRVSVALPGPLSIILALLMAGLVAVIVLLLLLGMVVVWIPITVAVIAAFVLSARVRGLWRRLRGGEG